MTGIAIEDIIDAIDAMNQPQMFYVADSEDFECRIRRFIIASRRQRDAINGKRQPSASDLQYIRACAESLNRRLAAAVQRHRVGMGL